VVGDPGEDGEAVRPAVDSAAGAGGGLSVQPTRTPASSAATTHCLTMAGT
jgi:hypothetical protein